MNPETSLETLLEFLRDARGFDFTGYKRTTLARRVAKRMEAVRVTTYEQYMEVLELRPEEFAALFDMMLINVTAFFRDAPAWQALRDEVLGRLLSDAGPEATVRIWSAGCASGEETYTLAILLCEALGTDEFLRRVKIYATDVDEDALREARAAVYPSKAVDELPAELVERYFERVDQRVAFRKDLRRAVVFGRNDLVQDAPISRVDLLTCRNTLMYFNADTQAQILNRLHFALRDHGAIMLGKSEMLTTQGGLFRAIDLKNRIFQKVPREGRPAPIEPAGTPRTVATPPADHHAARAAAFETAPLAQLVLDPDGLVLAANASARRALRIDTADVGRHVGDLEVSYRPVELRSHLARVASEQRRLTLPPTGMITPTGERQIEVEFTPLDGFGTAGVVVAFSDVTERRRLLAEVESSRVELETAYEELQSTVEELETTNEELQSTNEELETTNEELQSTNEELETMNEELQSTNEEIATVNDELRTRSLQLDDVNRFLETILSRMGVAVAVVDDQQLIQLWNSQAEELWGVRTDEVVGHNLLTLDIGLPLSDLVEPVRDALRRGTETAETVLDAVNRRGRAISCRVSVLPLHTGEQVTGAVLLMADAAVSRPEAADDGRAPA